MEKEMNCLRWFNKGAMVAALLGTTFLGAFPARAQEAKTWREMKIEAKPDQEQGRLWLRPTIEDQADFLGSWSIARFRETADDMFGANLQPIGDTLRAQLSISAGQGLVVEGLRGDGA